MYIDLGWRGKFLVWQNELLFAEGVAGRARHALICPTRAPFTRVATCINTCQSNVVHPSFSMMHYASYQNTRFIPMMLYAEALIHDLQSISGRCTLFSCGRCLSDSITTTTQDARYQFKKKLFALFNALGTVGGYSSYREMPLGWLTIYGRIPTSTQVTCRIVHTCASYMCMYMCTCTHVHMHYA